MKNIILIISVLFIFSKITYSQFNHGRIELIKIPNISELSVSPYAAKYDSLMKEKYPYLKEKTVTMWGTSLRQTTEPEPIIYYLVNDSSCSYFKKNLTVIDSLIGVECKINLKLTFWWDSELIGADIWGYFGELPQIEYIKNIVRRIKIERKNNEWGFPDPLQYTTSIWLKLKRET